MSPANRSARRLLRRRFDVELDAQTRALVARVKRAHDDPNVDVDAFAALLGEWQAPVRALPDRERTAAALEVHEHAMRAITGRPGLTAVGVL